MIRKWYALWLLYLISDKILKLMHTFWCDVFIDFSDFAKDYINYHYRFWKALPPNNLTLLAYNEVSYIFPFRLSCMQWWISTEYSASRTSGMIETINIDLKMMRIILRKSFVNLVKHMLLVTVSFALWFLVFLPRYVATFFDPFLFTHVHLIVQEWLRTKLTNAARSN